MSQDLLDTYKLFAEEVHIENVDYTVESHERRHAQRGFETVQIRWRRKQNVRVGTFGVVRLEEMESSLNDSSSKGELRAIKIMDMK